MLRAALILGALVVLAAMAWVRLSPNPPARWQVDPLEAGRPGMENGYLIRPDGGDAAAPIYPVSPADLAVDIDRIARAWPRTRLLAGSVASGRMTYVTRSRVWGFPDFTTIRVLPVPGGATFAAFARARFGRSDLGVNKARLMAWLDALASPSPSSP